MPREPNEIDSDTYNDRLFTPEIPERDWDAVRKDRIEEEDAERARQELLESGKMGMARDYPGSLLDDCRAANNSTTKEQ